MPLLSDQADNHIIYFDRVSSLQEITSSGNIAKGGIKARTALKILIQSSQEVEDPNRLQIYHGSRLVLQGEILSSPFDIQQIGVKVTLCMHLKHHQCTEDDSLFQLNFYEEASAEEFYNTCNSYLPRSRRGLPFQVEAPVIEVIDLTDDSDDMSLDSAPIINVLTVDDDSDSED